MWGCFHCIYMQHSSSSSSHDYFFALSTHTHIESKCPRPCPSLLHLHVPYTTRQGQIKICLASTPPPLAFAHLAVAALASFHLFSPLHQHASSSSLLPTSCLNATSTLPLTHPTYTHTQRQPTNNEKATITTSSKTDSPSCPRPPARLPSPCGVLMHRGLPPPHPRLGSKEEDPPPHPPAHTHTHNHKHDKKNGLWREQQQQERLHHHLRYPFHTPRSIHDPPPGKSPRGSRKSRRSRHCARHRRPGRCRYPHC